MKASDLLRLRELLEDYIISLSLDKEIIKMSDYLKIISNSIDIDVEHKSNINKFVDNYQQIFDNFINLKSNIELEITNITNLVDQKGYDINMSNLDHLFNHFINGEVRETFVTPEINHIVKSSILKYVDWHYPVLQFGCRFNNLLPRKPKESYKSLGQRLNDPDLFMEFEDSMTGGEPFYVCDFNQESMNRCIEKFNPVFQSKICDYVIEDADFSNLPQGQFGLIFSWNLFNYATPDILTKYLEQLVKLLRPGGTLIFNYNNCDLPASMMMSEVQRESYMPKRHLIDLVTKFNLELINSYDITNEADLIYPYSKISWVEIKKPGILKTCKAHSSLGKISVEL